MPRATGWVRNDDERDRITESLGADCSIVGAAVGGEALAGYAERQIARGNHGVFPHLAEWAFRETFTDPYSQSRGVCVGIGTATAIQFSWLYSIAEAAVYGRPALVDVASIYAGGRTQRDLGNGSLRGDGSNGAWAAKWVHDHGAIEQQKIGGYDLRGLNEELAVKWGAPGKGVPQPVLNAGKGITIDVFRCRTADDIADCAFAGYGMAFCHDFTFGPKDSNGVSRLSEPASHCTALMGGAVMASGAIVIGGQQSWGPQRPSGRAVLRYRDGAVKLRKGMCFVPLDEFDKALSRGGAECWAFQVTQGWRPKA